MGCGQSTNSILEPKGRKIIMFGGAGSGKTSILYQLTKKMSVSAIPTVGHNAEHLQIGKERFVLYDIGARNTDFSQIHHLLDQAVAVVFVVDATNQNAQMFQDSVELFTKIIQNRSLLGLPLALCLNKSESADRIYIDEERVRANYPMNQLQPEQVKIFKISQKTLLNIEEPFKWIANLKLQPVGNRQQQHKIEDGKNQPVSPKKKNQNINSGIPVSQEFPQSSVSKPDTQAN